MVLQRNVVIPFWGWADANEKIEIQFHHQKHSVKADKSGKWKINLQKESAGGPFSLVISANNHIIINNILVGEVWICGGQSNMEFKVNEVVNAKHEMEDAEYAMIRHFTVIKDLCNEPKEELLGGKWDVSNRFTVGDFTAVGYFFAKRIHQELNIPVGIINASWGGTDIESWISRSAFESSDEFKDMIEAVPTISLDSLSIGFIQRQVNRISLLQSAPVSSLDNSSFKELAFNDTKWPELTTPSIWENQELGDLDGVVWLRKTILVSALDAGSPAQILLARIFDEDITYVNGVEVGRMNNWNSMRKYDIPAGVLKEGANSIAIRIYDEGGSGGIFGTMNEMKIITLNTIIPLSGNWKYQVESIKSNIGKNTYPSLLYNAMINPLMKFAFKGVLWYQGESNTWRAFQYRKAFPLLINDWREKAAKGDFPFYFVQLASYNSAGGNSNKGSKWAELREAQAQTLYLPNTAMCITTDIGNSNDPHPNNKQDVGYRLSSIALNKLYQKSNAYTGPTFQSMEIQGKIIIANFEHVGTGFKIKDKFGYLKGFEIAGADSVFHSAKAFINEDHIVIYSDSVLNPIAIHYGWADDASENNLFNQQGFPAAPFRTDNWLNLTKQEKYSFHGVKKSN